MAAECLLGIDVGTTSVKAGVIGPEGVIARQFSQNYPTTRIAGNIEQDPDDWVRSIETALQRFSGDDIAALGLCSQVNTHVFVGEDGKPLIPAIHWQDARARTQASVLDAKVSDAQKIEWWGAPMLIDASHAIARMAWVALHQPEVWSKTRYVMLPKDYCLFRLTGVPSTDPLANIGLVGQDMAYLPGVFDLLPGAREKMAPLVPVTNLVGAVATGPFAGVPVVSGTMDAWASLIGAGAAREGRTVYLSGTSEIIGISSQTVHATPGVIVFPPSSGVRLHAGPTNNGGDAQAWFAQVSGIGFDQMSEMVRSQPRSEHTPLFLPQLEGERAPLWNPELRGAFIGISRKTAQADFARAVQEGVAFAARHILETLHASAGVTSDWIAGGGGGFQSDSWNQIRADVIGVPIKRLASNQPGVLGAAMIAGFGAGYYPDIAATAELVQFDKTYTPNRDSTRIYDSVFKIYKDAIDAQAEVTNHLRAAANI